MTLAHARNHLVHQLSPADRRRLTPHFEAVPLAFKQSIYEHGAMVDHLYFPESGVISMVTPLEQGDAIETGTVGSEGFVGIPAVLGIGRAPGRAFCQIPGSAWRLPAALIAEERQACTPLFLLLLRYVSVVMAMLAQSAACNRAHQVEARMSRWLLMTHDRVDGDDFPITQEFLATMLGVSRPTVNIAGAILQRAGFIQYSRGHVKILNRAGLESGACECYRRIQEALQEAQNGAGAVPAGTPGRKRRAKASKK